MVVRPDCIAARTLVVFTLLFACSAGLSAQPITSTTSPPVYLAFPFRCIVQNGQVVLAPTDRLYYHEALDYQPAAPHKICPTSNGYPSNAGVIVCRKIELTALRLVCKNGIVSAPLLTLARKSREIDGVRLQGDSLLVPISQQESYYLAPAGFGILPRPDKLLTHDDFISMYDPAPPPVSQPRSFFLTLYHWAPLPQLVFFPLYLVVGVFAFLGFYINPEFKLLAATRIVLDLVRSWLLVSQLRPSCGARYRRSLRHRRAPACQPLCDA